VTGWLLATQGRPGLLAKPGPGSHAGITGRLAGIPEVLLVTLQLADTGSGAGQTMSHDATGSPFTKNNRRRAITELPSAPPRRSAPSTGVGTRATSSTAAQASQGNRQMTATAVEPIAAPRSS